MYGSERRGVRFPPRPAIHRWDFGGCHAHFDGGGGLVLRGEAWSMESVGRSPSSRCLLGRVLSRLVNQRIDQRGNVR
jgi:hypothetical protein